MTDLLATYWRHSDQIFEIELAAPPANVLSSRMMASICRELEQTSGKKDLKAIVFSNQGAHFSYGASVEEHEAGQVEKMLPDFHRFVDRILSLPVLTVTRASGLCLGGAFEMVMATDLVFCDESARFAVPEIQLGVFPPVACALLPEILPAQVAYRMILTGEQIRGEELKNFGFIARVFAPAELKAGVENYLEKNVLPRSAESLRQARLAVRGEALKVYRQRIAKLEEHYLGPLMATADAREGIRSFIEKRKPEWKNN